MIIFRKKAFLIIFVLFILISSIAVLGTRYNLTDSINIEATKIVIKCSLAERKDICYESTIPSLMNEGYSLEEVFAVTREVLALDESYSNCHLLAHYISDIETQKDPTKWKEVMVRTPFDICGGGGPHGVFLSRYRSDDMASTTNEYIINEFNGICDNRPGWKGYQISNCRHALGHLLVYITAGDFDRSLDLCESLIGDSDKDIDRQTCFFGVFMQLFQPVEPEDFALIEGKEIKTKAEAYDYCNKFTASRNAICNIEKWPLFMDVLNNPLTAHEICLPLEESLDYMQLCVDVLFQQAFTLIADGDSKWPKIYCSQVKEPFSGRCFASSAIRLIEINSNRVTDAVYICNSAIKEKDKDVCFEKLLNFTSNFFDKNDKRLKELCNSLPGEYLGECINFAT
jgi:hypothetical protein